MKLKMQLQRVSRLKRLSKDYFVSLIVILKSQVSFSRESSQGNHRIFTLDLHTSVVRDLRDALTKNNFVVNRFSISAASHLFGEENLRLPFISGKSWKKISTMRISLFRKLFRSVLRRADSFLVTYTFSFVMLFAELKKPILAVNATRYESPFTSDKENFEFLNRKLVDLTNSGLLTVISNNAADRDYLKFFTGIDSPHIPSLCSYSVKHNPKRGTWLIMCRNLDLGMEISRTIPNASTIEEVFPNGYTHEEFAEFAGVILIPYNISTMRLFEISTSGMPVRIPSDNLLKIWSNLPGVLSELSWVQVNGVECPDWLKDTPADPNWDSFLDWWLDRADWNFEEYFPNISRFDAVDELQKSPPTVSSELMAIRNQKIESMHFDAIDNFARGFR